jgi:hypothetical protein
MFELEKCFDFEKPEKHKKNPQNKQGKKKPEKKHVNPNQKLSESS